VIYMRKLLFLCTVLALTVCANAQNPKHFTDVDLSIDSSDGIYQKGDTVYVYADVSADFAGKEITMTVNENYKEVSKQTLALSAGRNLIYKAAYQSAMHCVVALSPKSDAKKTCRVGWLVSPHEYRPGFAEPDDLMEFWNDQIAKMRKKKLKAKLTKVTVPASYGDKFECYALEIPMHEGWPVRGYVAWPTNALDKSLPILIQPHAAGVSLPGNRASIETALRLAKKGGGCIGLDINAHGYKDDQPQEYYDALDAGELKNYRGRVADSHEAVYFRLMYLRMVRALDYLTSLSIWDGKRVVCSGTSQGGAQSAALAGLDNRVTAIALRVPAVMDVGAMMSGRKGSWPPEYAKSATKSPTKDYIPYYDTALLLKHSCADVFMIAGIVDFTCPAPCIAAAYNVAGSTNKVIRYCPYMAHGTGTIVQNHRREVFRETILEEMDEYIEKHLK
jgi:cephalosporin-C deacetylase-like acetyl esterase